jgi:hypothetical protein
LFRLEKPAAASVQRRIGAVTVPIQSGGNERSSGGEHGPRQ